MGSVVVAPFGQQTVNVPAAAKVSSYAVGDEYNVNQVLGYPNQPNSLSNLFTGQGAFTSAAFTLAGQAVINAGAFAVLVNVGASAVPFERQNFQATPGVLNATGTLTAAMILAGLVTSTTGAAVVATLDTGTIMDAAVTMAAGDSFDWSATATGANSFTVTASAGHTIVGSGVVATVTTGRFRTTKTATNTFITYRLA